jgi:hypothetical protein
VGHPKTVGDRSTLAVMLGLCEAGFTISVPFGENTRYDILIDDGARVGRVQCKTGRLRDGAVRFSTCSTYAHHTRPQATRRDYSGEVDYFGVYCPDNGGIYLVPIEDANVRVSAALRVAPSRNSQVRRIRAARPYQLGTFSRG